MEPIRMLGCADLLFSRIGLVIALVLGVLAVLVLLGAEQLSGVCGALEKCGVVLAFVVGALHNALLWRRFGFLLKGLSLKALYGQCPRLLILLSIVGFGMFVGLLTLSASPQVSPGYTALVLASFFVACFSLCLGQATSLLYGANQSFHRTCAKSRAGR